MRVVSVWFPFTWSIYCAHPNF